MVDNLYKALSEERKQLQALGDIPPWAHTGAWQAFKDKYLYDAPSWKAQCKRIAKTVARHMKDSAKWEEIFFNLMWDNYLSLSSPALGNTGTERGFPVSCSGGYVDNSIRGFYTHALEASMLSKYGFGTSSYLGDIAPRGTPLKHGGKASGVVPVYNMLTQVSKDVSQGGVRRGSIAGYIPLMHDDVPELMGDIENNPSKKNIGWVMDEATIKEALTKGTEANKRWKETLRLKMMLGRGYYFFSDKVNAHRPQMYKDHGLDVKGSNLCSEIALHCSNEYTFTCILSSINVVHWDKIKDSDVVFNSTVFLDCLTSEFLELSKDVPELRKAWNFTNNGRAIGLGQMGLFSLFQKKRLDPEGFEAHNLNVLIAKHIHDESLRASQWLAKEYGEPLWCKGYGVRNTHRIAIAPTKSSAGLMGGWSEGINPDPGMAFSADGASGDIDRLNPILLELIKEKGLNVEKCRKEILKDNGSVQKVKWLSAEEKTWFKTGFEISPYTLLRLAGGRTPFIDQGQSLNLWLRHNHTPKQIANIHKAAMLDPKIHALYYIYSNAEIKADSSGESQAPVEIPEKDDLECIACQ